MNRIFYIIFIAILSITLFVGLTKPNLVKHIFFSSERYVVYLDQEFELENLRPIFNVLEIADANDEVDIYVSSPGGSVNAMAFLIQLIKDSPADVRYIVVGDALSAAAATMCHLRDDQLIIDDAAVIMFHQARFVTNENQSVPLLEMAKENPQFVPFVDAMTIRFEPCKRFLTKEELARYEAGEDVFISGKEFKKRLATNKITPIELSVSK